MKIKYKTIAADPPWPYRSSELRISPNRRPNTALGKTGGVSSRERYGIMSMSDLKRLPVYDLSYKCSHLYLWCTNSFMVEAHGLARAWGFEPKTILTWVKTKKDGTISMKMGYYYRGASEHILFAVRGVLRLQGKPRPTVYLSKRLPHSIKPEWFYSLVEEQSLSPRLELFARKNREGWDAWGNEIESNKEVKDRLNIG